MKPTTAVEAPKNVKLTKKTWLLLVLCLMALAVLCSNRRATRSALATTTTTQGHSHSTKRRKQDRPLKLDILSVGSNARPELFFEGQAKSFATAHTGFIRRVIRVTEDDDFEASCKDGTMTDHQAQYAKRWCKNRYIYNQNPKLVNKTSYYMRRNVNMGRAGVFNHEGAKWICAQKRVSLGLTKVLRSYDKNDNNNSNSSMPDFLLVVDDDTWYDIDALVTTVLQDKDSRRPFVGAGCRFTKTDDYGLEYIQYYGGMGLVLSRGTLERLMHPLQFEVNSTGTTSPAYLHANMTMTTMTTTTNMILKNNQQWEQHAHNKLTENLILENELFRPGMSLLDLMDAYTKAESFEKIKRKWKRGFCFHSDNFLSYFIEHYRLHENRVMDVLQPRLWDEADKVIRDGICHFKERSCPDDAMMCHYVTSAQEMQNRTIAAAAAKKKTG